MKRILTALVLTAALLTPALAAGAPTFSDVAADAWYAPYVAACAQDGLMNGTGASRFTPQGTVTTAEAATLAARIHSLTHGGDGTFSPAPADWGQLTLTLPDGTSCTDYAGPGGFDAQEEPKGGPHLTVQVAPEEAPWAEAQDGKAATVTFADGFTYTGTMLYMAQEGALVFLPDFGETSNSYIDRCRQLMAIPTPEQWYRDAMWYLEQNDLRKALGFQSSDQTATRLQLAQAIALTAGELEPINQVSPASDLYDDQWDLVKPLYEAGILNGVDGYGTFRPQGALSRAEAATMAARVLRPELRLTGGTQALPDELEALGLRVTPLLPADEVTLVDGDTALIYTGDGRVLDWMGTLVCDLSGYEDYAPFASDQLAVVQQDGLWGFVDLTGKEIIPCRYETITTFHDYALAAGSAQSGYTLFDREGDVLGTVDGNITPNNTSQQFIQYQDPDTGLYGYLNRDGSVAVEAAYTAVYPYSYNYAAVRDGSGLAGFVDRTGKLVIPCQFETVAEGFNYLDYAVVGSGGLLGICNTAGELVIPMSYSSLGNFSGGLAPFVRQGTDGALTVGYLTTDGTEHFPDQLAGTLSLPFPYVNDTAIFEENGLYGLMDTQFQTVLPPAFPFALQAASGAQVIVEAEGMLFRIAL